MMDTNDPKENGVQNEPSPRPRRRRPAPRRPAARRPAPPPQPEEHEESGSSFLSKDDLSRFFSIKPYLSEKGQAVVDLLAEANKPGGNLDPAVLGKLAGLAGGGQNLNALAPLLSLASSAGGTNPGGGKLDPASLLPLLTSLTNAGSGGKLDPAALLPLITALAAQNKPAAPKAD